MYTEIDKDRMSEPIRRETGRTNFIQNVERLDKWTTTVVPTTYSLARITITGRKFAGLHAQNLVRACASCVFSRLTYI